MDSYEFMVTYNLSDLNKASPDTYPTHDDLAIDESKITGVWAQIDTDRVTNDVTYYFPKKCSEMYP